MESLQYNNQNTFFLFPYKFKYGGFLLIFFGLIAGYLYYFGGKPNFFEIPVFALLTSYLETRYFVLAQTNMLDELAVIFIIGGFTLVNFTKEKNESETFNILRLKAFIYASYFSIVIWIITIMVIYGWPIFIFSSFVFVVFMLVYQVIFKVMVFRNK